MCFFRFFLIGIFIFLSGAVRAQSNPPIPLNQHFFEISTTDTLNHVYNKIVSYAHDSVKIERSFTLENKLVRVERTSPHNHEFREYSVEKYAENGDLIEKTTVNMANSKYLSTYFHEGEQVGQAMHRGENKFRIFRNGYDEPKESLYNDFEPNPIEDKQIFYTHIALKVSFTMSEYPKTKQMAVIGVYIDEDGKATNVEWVNPLGTKQKLANKYLKAIKKWKYNYSPALDHRGSPVRMWKYFHFHFGRSSSLH